MVLPSPNGSTIATRADGTVVAGCELALGGFAEDVEIALEVDMDDTVPVLADGAFVDPTVR